MVLGDIPAHSLTVSDVLEAFDESLHPQCNGPIRATASEVKLLYCPGFDGHLPLRELSPTQFVLGDCRLAHWCHH